MDTESIFYVQLVKSDVISFKMIGKDDLKLKYLPTPLLNYISQGHMPFDLIKSVHRTIRNFEGSDWEAMIKERGTYYKEIEDKVLVTLENWEKEGGDINKNANLQVGYSVNNKRDTMEEEIPTNTIHYAESKEQNNVYSLNDEDKSMRGYIGLLLIIITAVFGTLLYSLAYREMNILHDTVLKHIHEMSDTTRNNILLTILVMAIPILFMIRWKRKRTHFDKEEVKHTNNTDMVDDNDEGYNDFLRMLADKGTEKGHQDEAIDDISQLSEITSSPRSSPKRMTKLIQIPPISTTHSNSPSKKLRKRDRVLKGIKKAASLPILDIGKKKKNG